MSDELGFTEEYQEHATLLDLERLAIEPLVPELQECVYVDPALDMKVLKHPLVFSVPLMLPGQANLALRQKKAMLDDALKREDWASVIWIHERPYRCWALIEYVVGWDDDTNVPIPLNYHREEVRDLAADVWVDSENIGQHEDDWAAMFSGWECGDEMLFSDDPKGWATLPDPLTVYRAGIDDGGWSWTLDPKVAVFFAKRFGTQHVMSTGRVPKNCVFGYLTRRSESEVLIPDRAVIDVRPFMP